MRVLEVRKRRGDVDFVVVMWFERKVLEVWGGCVGEM